MAWHHKLWPWGSRQKASAVTQTILMTTTPGVAVSPLRDYELFAREGYANSAIVYACINEIAKAIGGLRWIAHQRRRGRLREIDEHPLLALLRRPNPLQGGGRFFELLTGYLMISGNTYIERVGPGSAAAALDQPPRELYALRPDRMKVVPGSPLMPIQRYEYQASGVITKLPEPLVLHLKLFHPLDDWYGLSPLQVLAQAVDTDSIATSWNFQLIKKGARPSGALVVERNLTDAQYARLKTQVEEQVGASEAGRPLILEGGMDWKEMGITPRDMDWIESRRMTKQDIAMAYGVPAELIGLKEATYENRREAKRAFYTETVLPLADFLRDDLNNWLAPLYGDNLTLTYDRDAIEALQEDREKLWMRVKQADWLTVNEKRIATGYDERPDGDTLLVPFNVTRLEDLGDTGETFADLATDRENP